MITAMPARTRSTYERISHSSNPLVGANVHRRAACEQGLVDDVCTQPVTLYSGIASIPGSCQLVSNRLLIDKKDDRHQAVREVLQYVQWQPEHHREGAVTSQMVRATVLQMDGVWVSATHLCLMDEMCTVGIRSTLCLLHISSRANTLVDVTCDAISHHIMSCHAMSRT